MKNPQGVEPKITNRLLGADRKLFWSPRVLFCTTSALRGYWNYNEGRAVKSKYIYIYNGDLARCSDVCHNMYYIQGTWYRSPVLVYTAHVSTLNFSYSSTGISFYETPRDTANTTTGKSTSTAISSLLFCFELFFQ